MNQELAYSSVMTRLKNGFEGQRSKIRSEWRGEKVILDRSIKIQERLNRFDSRDEKVRNKALISFGTTVGVYTNLFLTDRKPPTDDEIYKGIKAITNLSESPTFEELNIQTEYLSSVTAARPQFREKAIKFLQERCQEETITFLFRGARETAAKPFDPDRELRQIRAVNHMLAGDNVAMDTGDGKTSVVIPIFSLTNSIIKTRKVSGFPSLILSSADTTLTSDLKQKTLTYRKVMVEAINKLVKESGTLKLDRAILGRLAILPEIMELPEVIAGHDDLESYFAQQPSPLAWMSSNGINIGFQPHDKAVFAATDIYMDAFNDLRNSSRKEDQERNQKKLASLVKVGLPTYVFDEVNLLAETPYIQRQGGISKEGKININHKEGAQTGYLNYYLTMRLAHETLLKGKANIQKYTESEGQVYQLTRAGSLRLTAMRKQMVADLKKYVDDPKQETSLIRKLLKIIKEEIEPACEFDRDYRGESLNTRLKDIGWSRADLDPDLVDRDVIDRSSTQDQFLTQIFEEYLRAITSVEKGVDYINPDKIRDRLRGILLPSRKFTGMVPFQLNLSEGKFAGIDEAGVKNRLNFPTWVAAIVQGNVVGLSNDLFYTDPSTGKRELSTLGEVLEKHTDGYVVDLAPKKELGKALPFPDPEITRSKSSLIKKVYKEIDSRINKPGWRQEMVVCWDEEMGDQLYKSLLKTKKKVGLINSQLSDKQADLLHLQFANGEIDFLVTTGRKSFGADFKNKDGKFTDFRVNVINPETSFQIAQAFGRRRLDKRVEDFSIYFDENSLLFLGSILNESTKKSEAPLSYFVEQLLKTKTSNFDELTELINRSLNKKGTIPLDEKGRARLKVVTTDILRQNQKLAVSEWERALDLETYFIQRVVPEIVEKKQQLIRASFNSKGSPTRTLLEEEVKRAIKQKGLGELPKQFQDSLLIGAGESAIEAFSAIENSIYEDYSNQMSNDNTAPQHITTRKGRDGYLLDLFDKRIDGEYKDLWEDQLSGKDNHFVQHILREQVQNYLDKIGGIFNFMGKELRERGKTFEDVENFNVLFSPIFFPNLKKPPLPFGLTMKEMKVTNGQTIRSYAGPSGKPTRYIIANKFIIEVDEADYENRIETLNRDAVLPGTYKKAQDNGNKVLDIFYPGKTTRFIRIVLKKPEPIIIEENEREDLLG